MQKANGCSLHDCPSRRIHSADCRCWSGNHERSLRNLYSLAPYLTANSSSGHESWRGIESSSPVCLLEDIINDVDLVLLMSVNPGFGGQKFIENTIGKVKRLRELINQSGKDVIIEVDGGVQAETAPRLVAAGTDMLVSGSYVFKADDPIATIHDLKEL